MGHQMMVTRMGRMSFPRGNNSQQSPIESPVYYTRR